MNCLKNIFDNLRDNCDKSTYNATLYQVRYDFWYVMCGMDGMKGQLLISTIKREMVIKTKWTQ
jgi:hypothetical protein